MKQFKSLFTLVFRAMQSLSQLVVQLAATPEDNGAGAFSSKHVGVRESVNKSAASAASLDYVKIQTVIKSAASAASLRGGRATG